MVNPAPATLSQKEFAVLLGISPPMVTKHKQAGRLVMDEDNPKLVRVAESIAAINAWKDPARGGDRTGKAETDSPRVASPAVSAAARTSSGEAVGQGGDADRLNYNAQAARHKLAEAQRSELMLAREAGELVNKAERDAAEFGRARAAREAVMSIADRIAVRVAAEPDSHKCHGIIEAECRRVCDMLATGAVVTPMESAA